MPILSNAKKALRSSKRKTVFNQRVRSRMRTMIANIKKAPSETVLPQVFSAIDKAVGRNLIHKNKAARLKSQMSKLVNSN